MIPNTTITRYTPKTGSDASGDPTYGSPVTLSVRGWMEEVTASERKTLGAVIHDAVGSLSVLKKALAASGITPAQGDLLTAAVDHSPAIDYEVQWVNNNEKRGGMSRWDLYLQLDTP